MGDTQPVKPLYTGRSAVVVGAGPAGSAAAMFLARQGFIVDVSGHHVPYCSVLQPTEHSNGCMPRHMHRHMQPNARTRA